MADKQNGRDKAASLNDTVAQQAEAPTTEARLVIPTDVLTILAARNVDADADGLYEALRALASENSRLAPLADTGRQYRLDLIEETLAEGVRATGSSFPQETYRQMLEGSTLDQIKALRASFSDGAAARFPGGRQTTDGEQPAETETTRVPDSDEPIPLIEVDNIPPTAYRGS